jgi:hypothetical protein
LEEKITLDHAIFVHVFDQVTQDSDEVLSILQDLILEMKNRNPMIENAYWRSDNGRCYHSAQTILSLPLFFITEMSTGHNHYVYCMILYDYNRNSTYYLNSTE